MWHITHCPLILNPKLPVIQNIVALIPTSDRGRTLLHSSIPGYASQTQERCPKLCAQGAQSLGQRKTVGWRFAAWARPLNIEAASALIRGLGVGMAVKRTHDSKAIKDQTPDFLLLRDTPLGSILLCLVHIPSYMK